MKNLVLCIIIFSLTSINLSFGQQYKEMMYDLNVNFYDVVKEAEKYFETHDKGKGSGWKGYQRWKSANEGKYYPSGIRNEVSPYFIENGYQRFIEKYPLIQTRGSFDNGWNDLGPYSANNITSSYSQGIGRVECFYVYPKDPQRMYLGSKSGGFWKTLDGGNNWTATTDFLIASGVNTMTTSPTNPDSVLINVRNALNGTTHGIYRSTNGGDTWDVTPFNPQNLGWGGFGSSNYISIIAISPFNSNMILIGSNSGLYRSTDNLQSWTKVLGGNIRQIDFHPSDPDIIYIYDRNNPNRNVILRSLDGGLTFSKSNTIPNNNGTSSGKISVSKDCPDCVFFASHNGVWKSIDKGIDFTYLSNPFENCDGFAVSDTDITKMIYGLVDIEASSNGGYSFNQVTWWSTNNANSDVYTNYVHADLRIAKCVNGIFYAGTDGYLAKSIDGGITWQRLNDGTGIKEYYRVGVSQSNYYVNMCGAQDNGTSILNQDGWIEWNGGDGMDAIIQPLNPDWMIGSWQYGRRNRTTDGGESRQNIDHGGSADWVAPIMYDPNNQMTVYSFGSSVYKSEEFGSFWQYLGVSRIGQAKHAAIAENNSDIIVAVRFNYMMLSTDGGYSFTIISANLPNTYSISDIAFDPRNDSTIIIVYDRYLDDNKRVYISKDLGNSWSNISYNLSAIPATTVVIDHTNSSNIYIGSEIGVYYKSMNGTQWNLYNPNLPNTSIRDLEIQYGTNTLRAATYGRGLWEYTLVDRNNFPSILTVETTEKPTETQPVEDLPINVKAVISYEGIISSVYLRWSVNTPTLDNIIPMINIQDSSYMSEYQLPNYPAETKMFFKIFAVGSNNDTTESYKFMYSYKPCYTRPSAIANASETAICKGNSVTLSGSGADLHFWDNNVKNGIPFYPSDTKTYTLTCIDENNCTNTNQITITVDTLNTSIIISDNSLTVAFDGATYQWLNCDKGYSAITGETMQTFSLPGSGNFAVQINKNGCIDTSVCFSTENQVVIYPNPGEGIFEIDMGNLFTDITITVFDITGKRIHQKNIKNKRITELDIQENPSGVYFVHIQGDDKIIIRKIMKN